MADFEKALYTVRFKYRNTKHSLIVFVIAGSFGEAEEKSLAKINEVCPQQPMAREDIYSITWICSASQVLFALE